MTRTSSPKPGYIAVAWLEERARGFDRKAEHAHKRGLYITRDGHLESARLIRSLLEQHARDTDR